jgi:uncharacterized ion transporter superfamily protein YfcC
MSNGKIETNTAVVQKKLKWWDKLPHTYVILFAMIVIAAILTWVLPAGEFTRATIKGIAKPLVVPGTYHAVAKSGAKLFDIFKSIPLGMEGAASIIFLIMLSTAGFAIISETGALENGIGILLGRIKKSNVPGPVVIWVVTFMFSVLGIIVGPEIQIPFTLIGVSIALGLGYDLIVGLGMIMGGGYMGFNMGPINASIIGTSDSIAGLPLFSGMGLRIVLWLVSTALVALITTLYANKIKKNPEKSLVKGISTEGLGFSKEFSEYSLNIRHKLVLIDLLLMFAAIIYGASKLKWYLDEMSAVFIIGGLVAGYVYGFKTQRIIDIIIKGLGASASIAMILGIARGIQIILENGKIMDTIINALAGPLSSLSPSVAAICISIVTAIMHFFIPSGSGLAVSIMPILAPLGRIVGISTQTTVLAFQVGATIPNYIFPTVGATMAMLGIARVPLDKWIRFSYKLVLWSFLISWVFILIAVKINYGPF